MPTLAETQQFQSTLTDISTLAQSDLATVWQSVSDLDQVTAADVMMTATPEIVSDYGSLAAQVSADFYETQSPDSLYVAKPANPPGREQLEKSVRWAMYAANAATPLQLLAGTVQRAVFDAHRETILSNVAQETGATWARYASSNACPFCRMLATRGADYSAKERALLTEAGRKYHDNCRCTAVPVRPGESYEMPGHVAKWTEQYKEAAKATGAEGEALDLNKILAHMRGADAAATQAAKRAALPNATKPKPVPRPTPALEFDKRAGRTWASQVWDYDDATDLFTEAERLAVFNYTSAGYERSNKILRGVVESTGDHELANARLLDSMIDKAARVPDDVIVTRTATMAAFGDVQAAQMPSLVGRSFRDNAFMSTSVEAVGNGVEAVAGQAPDYLLRLTVPKGSRGVYVSNENAGYMQQLSGFGKTENELILARGTRYRIDAVEPGIDGNPATIRATILDQNGAPI
ncbi:hypothetical protein CH253_08155 [Rhodococcus sp. 06-156-3C]|uniref:VG15 protein n=1 Tax=Rhodococcus sp. 06-156-3C TaxID=2022486 RepID=UPI000B9B7DF6|nr:ADP-ribosyltransferase [Rhodococcus sp. 06-156-3C]OZD23825.1 hypothetical protein CH253_08155 [Rhodococcus sp. 06-156-3C]